MLKSSKKEKNKLKINCFYAGLTKENSVISGDSYYYGEIEDNGEYYCVLSDGMGTGKKACEDSQDAIEYLLELLKSNFKKEELIGTLNSLLYFKFESDRYVTLDLCTIDRNSKEMLLFKAGSAPSFVVRDGGIYKYNSISLPLGILENVKCKYNSIAIKKNDIIVFITDGILDSIGEDNLKNKDFERYLEKIKNRDPQTIAGNILYYALKNQMKVVDDMTVLVAKIL